MQEIPSGYDAAKYTTERLTIAARDGARVRYRSSLSRTLRRTAKASSFYAYGAYGMAIPPVFNANRISLLDRGWACAIAHIRGGDDLGHQWFLDGKLTKRMNTFNDSSMSRKAWPKPDSRGRGGSRSMAALQAAS